MKTTVLFLGIFLLSVPHSFAQGYHVYHRVGPAAFTNSATVGYPDGQLAGTNYLCGLYAGTDVNLLQPVFLQNPSTLLHTFSSSGIAVFSGQFTMPGSAEVWMQFRAWPASYPTFEDCLASEPRRPVGTTAYFLGIRDNIIIELPIDTGPLWLEPVPEPGTGALAGGSLLVWIAWRRSRDLSSRLRVVC